MQEHEGDIMAKNDYDYIVFKVLTYLYGLFKREYTFDKIAFLKAIIRIDEVSEEYITDILRKMSEEGLIEGAVFQCVWGGEYILASGYEELEITTKGIHYLTENSAMQKVRNTVLEGTGIITTLVNLVLK